MGKSTQRHRRASKRLLRKLRRTLGACSCEAKAWSKASRRLQRGSDEALQTAIPYANITWHGCIGMGLAFRRTAYEPPCTSRLQRNKTFLHHNPLLGQCSLIKVMSRQLDGTLYSRPEMDSQKHSTT